MPERTSANTFGVVPCKKDTINTSTDKAHLRKIYRPKNDFFCVFLQEIVKVIGNWTLWTV
jgi:hypothetical protein